MTSTPNVPTDAAEPLLLTIGDVQERLMAEGWSVSQDRIRRFVKWGLLRVEVGENGYRYFTEMDVERIRLVIALQELGFSVAEIGYLVGLPPGGARNRVIDEYLMKERQRTTHERRALEVLKKERGS